MLWPVQVDATSLPTLCPKKSRVNVGKCDIFVCMKKTKMVKLCLFVCLFFSGKPGRFCDVGTLFATNNDRQVQYDLPSPEVVVCWGAWIFTPWQVQVGDGNDVYILLEPQPLKINGWKMKCPSIFRDVSVSGTVTVEVTYLCYYSFYLFSHFP